MRIDRQRSTPKYAQDSYAGWWFHRGVQAMRRGAYRHAASCFTDALNFNSPSAYRRSLKMRTRAEALAAALPTLNPTATKQQHASAAARIVADMTGGAA